MPKLKKKPDREMKFYIKSTVFWMKCAYYNQQAARINIPALLYWYHMLYEKELRLKTIDFYWSIRHQPT
jgi:hypothetical protein